MNGKTQVPRVEACIAYMQGIGWRLIIRKNFTYVVKNDKMKDDFNNPLWFSLNELRHAFKYGF